MHWKTKAGVFLVLSVLPFGKNIHYFLQTRVTHNWPRSVEALDELWIAAEWIVRNYKERGASGLAKARFIEIGAGRDFAMAIALRLMGVAEVTCLDVDRLARPELIAHAADCMAKRAGVDAPVLRDWADLESFGIKYLAPATLDTSALPDHYADCFYSVDTLEHIPHESLRKIMQAATRVLKPGGLSIHLVDYSDHFAGADPTVSRFNFLRYSTRQWAPYNTSFHYVNRLRHSQYLDLIKSNGFDVLHAETDGVPPQPEILEGLADQFKEFTQQDLFTLRGRLVARSA